MQIRNLKTNEVSLNLSSFSNGGVYRFPLLYFNGMNMNKKQLDVFNINTVL